MNTLILVYELESVLLSNNTSVRGNIMNEVNMELRKKMCLHIVSDDNFLKLGVKKGGAEFFKGCTQILIFSKIKMYNTTQATNLYEDTLNDKEFFDMHIIIVDDEFLSSVLFMFCYHNNPNYIFIKSSKFNKRNLILLKHNAMFYNIFTLPHFMLMSGLNTKEKQICKYIYQGYNSRLMGTVLGIDIKKISLYKNRIMQKIGCENKIHFYKAIINYFKSSTLQKIT